MDKDSNQKVQSEDSQSVFQKLKLPFLILIIGGLLTFLVYLFLVKVAGMNSPNLFDKPNLSSRDGLENQESFQGPADLSVSVQQECQNSIEKINNLSKCQEQKLEFLSKMEACQNYTFSLDNNKSIKATEGLYMDVYFSILQCFQEKAQQANNSPKEEIKSWLDEGAKLKSWESQFGSATCQSDLVIKAYTETYTEKTKLCYNSSQVNEIIDILKNPTKEKLLSVIPIGRPATISFSDSEVGCSYNTENILKMFKKVNSNEVSLANESENDKLDPVSQASMDFVLIFKKSNETVMQTKWAKENTIAGQNCLYLKAVNVLETLNSE